MPDLQISKKWDDGANIGVRVFEVVNVKGDNVTYQYEATTAKGGKTPAQIKAALVAALKAQRDARIASQPDHQDIDLGGAVLTVS